VKNSIVKSSLLILSLSFSTTLMAQDKASGESIYKSKCAACHGATGEGKVGPALKGTKLSEDELVAVLSKGKEGKKAPHAKPISGLTEEQVKAVAQYVTSLK
jgi:mono/diheme cytochrome c family protein